MVAVTTLPRGRAFSLRDLAGMPDDGRRYEIVDGTLVVTPSPSRLHQLVSSRLQRALDQACPDGLVVVGAPLDLQLDEKTVVQPDLMVLPSAQLHDETAALAPLVVVEILSPSTRRVDLELKRACYAAARCPSYWVVDPQVPSLTAWVLREGEYVGTVQVRGDDQFTTQQPYRVGLRPSQLVD